MILFLFLIFAVVASSVAEGLALTIAGVIAPIVTQLLKHLTDASGRLALIITVVVSAVVALLALYLSGEIHGIGDVLKQIGAVFALATVVYKFFMAPAPATR